MAEARLIEKLIRIEALYAGATTPGECIAAGRARERIIERPRATEALDPSATCWRRCGRAWTVRRLEPGAGSATSRPETATSAPPRIV